MTNNDFNNLINKLSKMDTKISQEVATTAVKQAGVMVQSQARLLISSDSGSLARSIKIKNEIDEKKAKSSVYTNSGHGPYYELGTGPNGEANHQGISPNVSPRYRQTGWMIPADAMTVDKAESYGFRVAYKNGDVIGYYTRGQMARPFMYPALHDQEDKIMKNTERLFKKKLKEICKK
jgi:HK97 gp10 family phage protein